MDTTAKLSLYDSLAILTPGFFILLLIHFWGTSEEFNDSVYNIFVIAILSFLVGIIYHKLIEYLCTKFHLRNNEDCIRAQLHKLNQDLHKYKQNTKGTTRKDLIIPEYYKAYYYLMEKNCLN